MLVRCVHQYALWIGLAGAGLAAIALLFYTVFKKNITYIFPYVHHVKNRLAVFGPWYAPSKLFLAARIGTYALLIAALIRPVIVDERSRVRVKGRALMLLLDMSGSMQLFDDLNDRRSRFEVAKNELIRFIDQRVDDSLGLVIFGATAFSRCPLTYDKKLLQLMVGDLELGMINCEGTVLAGGLAMALNRLKAAKAKSKIVVMLTDGEPSCHDIAPGPVIELAKKLGVRVYTIGVGSEGGGYAQLPFQGVVQCQTPLNKNLLGMIAQETGGAFFRAERPDELATIYQKIDALERTELEVPRYTRFYELFPWLLIGALCCLFGEWVMRWWLVF